MRLVMVIIAFDLFARLNAQVDSSLVDSLILREMMTNFKEIDSLEINNFDTVKYIPGDSALFGFYNERGIFFDTACSSIYLFREIYSWLGVRYRYAGLTKRGVDCSGFVRNVCNRVYGTKLLGGAGEQFKKCVPIERNDLEEGDLVFFKINKTYISHVGLYIGNGKFAHAAIHGGVIISSLNEKYYDKYYYISGRLLNTPKKKTW